MDLLVPLVTTVWIVSALLSLILFAKTFGKITLSHVAIAALAGPIGLLSALIVFGERIVIWKRP